MDRASPRSGRPPAGASAASLARFVSAPGSFLSTLVDTVAASSAEFPATEPAPPLARTRFFPGGESPCLTSESTAELHRPCGSGGKCRSPPGAAGGGELEIGLQQPYGGGPAAALLRHSSSPAGFLSHLMVDSGFSVTRGGEYPQAGNQSIHGMNGRRLKPQLSFSSRQDSLSHISEMGISETRDDAAANPYAASGFQIGSWDEHNSIIFPANSGKRGRSTGGDIAATLSSLDSQYGLSRTALDLENVENLFQIQQDSVPCKIRAKRGCATHPRSIAERERRSRISEKLKKLQELVPNMDKQTSTADMLDLAVQHIKGLQTQVQRLNQECAGCTCGSKLEIS